LKGSGFWLCTVPGLPYVTFASPEDLTPRGSGITCRFVTEREALQYGWIALRALRWLTRLPIAP